MAKQNWAYLPLFEISISLVFLALAAPLWFGSGVLYWPPGPVQAAVSAFLMFGPFLAIPLLALSLVTLSSRPQWTRGSESSRLTRNTLLFLTCLAVFPLLWWNTRFPVLSWFFGFFSVQLLIVSSWYTGIIWLVIGALLNVVFTFFGHYLGGGAGRTSKRKPGCNAPLGWAFRFLVLVGPFLLIFLTLSLTVATPVFAVYLGALVPALWPHYTLNRRR
jgi:hypothetical protein